MSEGVGGVLGVLTFGTALGCGLIAGSFFAFSTFVMAALARLPAPQGIAAMQAINVAVITPSFMAALFGTGLACVLLIGSLLMRGPTPGGVYVLLGSAAYLTGWTAWNHVRTAAALGAAGLLTFAHWGPRAGAIP